MWRKWWFWACLCGVLVLVSWAGARLYLTSSRLAGQVASRVQEFTGEQADLDGIDVGLAGTQFRGLRLFENGRENPWLAIDDLQTDLSLTRLLQGDVVPERITARGAHLTLRFDEDGNLLTRLPIAAHGDSARTSLPVVNVVGGTVVVEQLGRPAVSLDLADLTLDGGELRGAVVDPEWGQWKVGGLVDPATNRFRLTLTTPRVEVSPSLLRKIPFVPSYVWKQVDGAGDVSAYAAIDVLPEFHYHVEVKSLGATVELTALDLPVTDVTGRIRIDDGVVAIERASGMAARGRLEASGEIDLMHQPGVMSFQVRAKEMELPHLPKHWKLPEPIEGRLVGDAELRIEIRDGRRHLSGKGAGRILVARLAGQPAKSIRIELRAEDGRFVIRPLPPPSGFFSQAGEAAFILASRARQAARFAAAFVAVEPPPPAVLDVALELEDGDLGECLGRLNVVTPRPVRGRFTARATLTVPLDAPHDTSRYRLDGAVTLRDAMLGDVAIPFASARIGAREGVVHVDEFVARLGSAPHADAAAVDADPKAGTITGSARLPLEGDAIVELQLHRTSFAHGEDVVGSLRGDFRATCHSSRLADLASWRGQGTLNADGLCLPRANLSIDDARARVRLSDGTLSLTVLGGRLANARLAGSLHLALAAPFPFEGDFDLHDGSVRRLVDGPLDGQFHVDAQLRGQLEPLDFSCQGLGRVRRLQAADSPLGSARFLWQADRKLLRLHDLQAHFAGGIVTGAADVPFQPGSPAKIELTFAKVELERLAPTLDELTRAAVGGSTNGSLPALLAGTLSGQLVARRTAAPSSPWTANLEVDGEQIAIARVPCNRLRLEAHVADGRGDVRLEGAALDGEFRWESSTPLGNDGEATGRLRLLGLRLGRLWSPLGLRAALAPLDGVVSADLDLRGARRFADLQGTGRVKMERLAWASQEWSSRLEGDLMLSPVGLRVVGLAGNLGTGEVGGQLAFDFADPRRRWFAISLQRVGASDLLRPWPGAAALVDGPLNAEVRGTFGLGMRGAAQIALSRGSVAGIPASDVRLPFRWNVAAGSSHVRFDCHDASLQLADGRLTGAAALTVGATQSMNVKLRFHGVNSQRLFGAVGMSQQSAGELSGRAEFSADNLRSIDDLRGSFDIQLARVRGGEAPVLQQVLPFLALARSSPTTFRSGTVRAQLRHGVVPLESCQLVAAVLKLSMTGAVSLAGRLDLDVAANFRSLAPLGLSRLVRVPLPVANSLLADRLVYLHVGGTMREPKVQFRPLPFLADEVVRFFLGA